MKSNIRVVSILLGIFAATSFAADTKSELEAIQVELKPLRQKAYLEADVKKARADLDAAYKSYWDAVRVAMLRLDPSKKDLIEKDTAMRKELRAIATEQHASGKKPAQ
ncbi:MAG: hypothetical protein ACREKL_01030 [Chthoniobacterales bacterium]